MARWKIIVIAVIATVTLMIFAFFVIRWVVLFQTRPGQYGWRDVLYFWRPIA